MNKIKRDPKRGNLIASYRFNFTPFEKRPLNNLQNFERKVSNFPIYLRLQNVIIRNDTIFRNRNRLIIWRKISLQKDLVESIVNARVHFSNTRESYTRIFFAKNIASSTSLSYLSPSFLPVPATPRNVPTVYAIHNTRFRHGNSGSSIWEEKKGKKVFLGAQRRRVQATRGGHSDLVFRSPWSRPILHSDTQLWYGRISCGALWTVWSWHTMRITVAPLCTTNHLLRALNETDYSEI